MLLAGASAATSFSGCASPPTIIAECVIGTHYPPGREDTCVPNAVSHTVQARLLAAAETAARENHGTVRRAVAVESLRSNAERYTDRNLVTGDGIVWLVEVSGDFKCDTECIGVPLRPTPTGTVITLDVDTKTFDVTGFGLGNKWFDLTHLGPVVNLRS